MRASRMVKSSPPTVERDDDRRRENDLRLVPARKLAEVVAEWAASRGDGQASEVAAKVCSELIYGAVALLRLLPQRHQQNGIEIRVDVATMRVRLGFHWLGRRGTVSPMISATRWASLPRDALAGLWPVSSQYSTTPSEYTSLTVVIVPPLTCFRARVVERHHPDVHGGELDARQSGTVVFQQLGDAEVEQASPSRSAVTRILLGFRSR